MAKAAEKEEKPQPPRVLHLCAVDFTVRQFVAPFALYLQSNGCEVRVACTKGPYWEELKSWGLNMVPMRIARSANLLSHLLSIFRLKRYLKKHPVDILHVHTPIAALVGRIAGRMAGVPTIIYTAHGFYFHDRMKPWKYRLHVWLEKFAARYHDYLFCVSEEDARTAERLGIDVPSRIYVVRNGVDPERHLPELRARARAGIRQELKIPEDAPVVTILGRMTREKGFIEFFQAARAIREAAPETHFLAVGDVLRSERDRIRRQVERIAAESGLDGHAHLVGFRTDVPELLAASDIFCLPSHREGLPVSIIEAMMMELPVVATNIRGCREEVVDGSTGLLVPVKSPEDIAGAVTYLLKHPNVAKKLGAAGRRRALEMFALKPTLETQWRVYQKIIAGLKR